MLRLPLFLLALILVASVQAADRPNILWITAEDMSANLPAYGDHHARTPHLDGFAREAVRYTHAFASSPVCAPARATLITGMYSNSLGNPHLRCEMRIPSFVRGYAAYLRDAGYHTTNNVKTDYNLLNEQEFIRETWDESSAQAHWRGRPPGRPFMAIFNFMETHQSRTSAWPEAQFEQEIGSELAPHERVDPATVSLPPFYPDTPASRKAMARYYDCISVMDKRVGRVLRELQEDGLAEDTIVFFYSDHGMGMPRGKRLLHDSGMHVPLMIRFPEKWRHLAPARAGETTDRLVSFVDFGPTVLSLAGVPVPAHMQGTPFLGAVAGPAREFVFGSRDRVDEAYDTARSVRDHRWLYIRNFRPDLSWTPPESYSDTSDFRRELLRGVHEGRLGRGPTAWLAPQRPAEELYDTRTDPHQLQNLMADPAHAATALRLREKLHGWMVEMRDASLLSEEDVLARARGTLSPYEVARDEDVYPFEQILAIAERVGRHGEAALAEQRRALRNPDPAVRRWAIIGLRAQGGAAAEARADVERALQDSSATVRIEAAGTLLGLGEHRAALDVLATALDGDDSNIALHAARTLELAGSVARPLRPLIESRFARAEKLISKTQLERYITFSLGSLLETLGR